MCALSITFALGKLVALRVYEQRGDDEQKQIEDHVRLHDSTPQSRPPKG